jgi:hypothetical protein
VLRCFGFVVGDEGLEDALVAGDLPLVEGQPRRPVLGQPSGVVTTFGLHPSLLGRSLPLLGHAPVVPTFHEAVEFRFYGLAPRYVQAFFLPFVVHYISLFINVTKTDEANPAKNERRLGTGPTPVVRAPGRAPHVRTPTRDHTAAAPKTRKPTAAEREATLSLASTPIT